MKNLFVRDLQPNETITTHFLVQSKEVRMKKSGEPYLSLTLSDKTGQLDAKMWDGIEEIVDTFDRDDFLKVKGLVQVYRNKPQMTIHKLRRADEREIELGDFLPHTAKDIDEMFATLRGTVEGMQNPHLRGLLLAFLDDEEIAARLKRAPAAKTLHHAFVGGLLEHLISLLNLAKLVSSNYDFVDLELVQAGVVLHDLGKIYELSYDRAFGYSDEGQLLGHITIVMRLIDRKCAAIPDFPAEWKLLVEHLVLSHHGKYEFGSPKLPSFPEALLLHYIDDLDSKLESMRATIANDPQIEGNWTGYNASLERFLLKKEMFLNGPPPEAGQPLADGQPASHAAEHPVAQPAARPADGAQNPARPAAKPKRSEPPVAEKKESLSLFGERLKSALGGETA